MVDNTHDLERLIARYNGAIEKAKNMSSFNARRVQEQVTTAVKALETYGDSHPDYPVQTILQQVLGGS
jgi:hypothetical protein